MNAPEQSYGPILQGSHYITSPYTDSRRNPTTGVWQSHRAIDIRAAEGESVRATYDGTVLSTCRRVGKDVLPANPNLGKAGEVVIQDDNGAVWTYRHLGEILVNHGQSVKKGQIVAKIGAQDDRSTAPHLHAEAYRLNEKGEKVPIKIQELLTGVRFSGKTSPDHRTDYQYSYARSSPSSGGAADLDAIIADRGIQQAVQALTESLKARA